MKLGQNFVKYFVHFWAMEFQEKCFWDLLTFKPCATMVRNHQWRSILIFLCIFGAVYKRSWWWRGQKRVRISRWIAIKTASMGEGRRQNPQKNANVLKIYFLLIYIKSAWFQLKNWDAQARLSSQPSQLGSAQLRKFHLKLITTY